MSKTVWFGTNWKHAWNWLISLGQQEHAF